MKIRNVGFYWLLLMAVLSTSWCRLSLAQDAEVDAAALAKPYAETSNRYTESMAKKIVLATTRVTSTSGSTTRTVSETEQIQFNREDLLQCQRALESRFPPTAHQDH